MEVLTGITHNALHLSVAVHSRILGLSGQRSIHTIVATALHFAPWHLATSIYDKGGCIGEEDLIAAMFLQWNTKIALASNSR